MQILRLSKIAHIHDPENLPAGVVDERRRASRQENENILRSLISTIIDSDTGGRLYCIRKGEPANGFWQAYEYLALPDFCTFQNLNFFGFDLIGQRIPRPDLRFSLYRRVNFEELGSARTRVVGRRPTRVLLPLHQRQVSGVAWRVPYPSQIKYPEAERSRGINQLLKLRELSTEQQESHAIVISVHPIRVDVNSENEHARGIYRLIAFYRDLLQEKGISIDTYEQIIQSRACCFLTIEATAKSLLDEFRMDIANPDAFVDRRQHLDTQYKGSIWNQVLQELPGLFSVDEVAMLIQFAISFGDPRDNEFRYLLG